MATAYTIFTSQLATSPIPLLFREQFYAVGTAPGPKSDFNHFYTSSPTPELSNSGVNQPSAWEVDGFHVDGFTPETSLVITAGTPFHLSGLHLFMPASRNGLTNPSLKATFYPADGGTPVVETIPSLPLNADDMDHYGNAQNTTYVKFDTGASIEVSRVVVESNWNNGGIAGVFLNHAPFIQTLTAQAPIQEDTTDNPTSWAVVMDERDAGYAIPDLAEIVEATLTGTDISFTMSPSGVSVVGGDTTESKSLTISGDWMAVENAINAIKVTPDKNFAGLAKVHVEVKDEDDATASTDIIYQVNDVDPTIIADSSGLQNDVAEGSPAGTVVKTIATLNDTSGLTFAIATGNIDLNGNQVQAFTINPTTGVITVNDPGDLDYESGFTNINLGITVDDEDPDLQADASEGFIFRITDAPEGPPALAQPDLAALADNGVSSTDNITNSEALELSGSGALAGATVNIYIGGVLEKSVQANQTGQWNASVQITEGTHNITARQVDSQNIESPDSTTLSVIVDRTKPAPLAPATLDPVSDSGLSNSDGVTSLSQIDLSVSNAETGSKISVLRDGIEITSATAPSSGSWLLPLSGLPNGPSTISLLQTDIAGNISEPSTPRSIIIDQGIPPAGPRPQLDSLSDTGSNAADGLTNLTKPGFTGVAESEGSRITLFVDGQYDSDTIAGPNGVWNATIHTPLADGFHGVSVRETDLAGHESPDSSINTFRIDTTRPTPPTTPLLDPASDTGILGDNLTSDNTIQLSGSGGEAFAPVRIYADGVLVGTGIAGASGNWSLTTQGLTAGEKNIVARAVDAAGNESISSASIQLFIDATIPTTPVAITALNDGTDTGASPSDGITANQTPRIGGTVPPDAVAIRVFDNGTYVGDAQITTPNSWTFEFAPLNDGQHTINTTAIDEAGNESLPSQDFTITIDTAIPDAALTVSLAGESDDGASAQDQVISQTTPTLAVTGASPDSTVRIYEGETLLGEASAIYLSSISALTLPSEWNIQVSALAEGTHTLVAREVDAAGNEGPPSSPLKVEVDLSAPAITVANKLSLVQGSETTVVGVNNLLLTDATAAPDRLIYTVESAPLLGTLALRGLTLSAGASFSQADVNSGAVTYTNTVLGEGEDSFSFTASDNVHTLAASKLSIGIEPTPINGGVSDEPLVGGLGSDLITGGPGGDRIDGGPGIDTAAFSGDFSNYRFAIGPDGTVYTAGPDGKDLLMSIEKISFGGLPGVDINSLLATIRLDPLAATISPEQGQSYQIVDIYSGPLPNLQYSVTGADGNDAIAIGPSNDYLSLLGGDDAANAGEGDDVIDNGTGSGFLLGDLGADRFIIEGVAGQPSWTTLADWQPGELVTLTGWRQGVSQSTWTENDGAESYTGATFHADLDGDSIYDASITFSGTSTAVRPAVVENGDVLTFA